MYSWALSWRSEGTFFFSTSDPEGGNCFRRNSMKMKFSVVDCSILYDYRYSLILSEMYLKQLSIGGMTAFLVPNS